jgi:hypothetical protein
MRAVHHSPPYVLQIRGRWRIVVPIRGKLSPKICEVEFATRASAEAWLRSEEGTITVGMARSRASWVREGAERL